MSLWFFEAWRAYFEETEDVMALREVFPVLSDMIEWHQRGTRYGIGVDPAEGSRRGRRCAAHMDGREGW
jgi:4-alpha-glucanotransferase